MHRVVLPFYMLVFYTVFMVVRVLTWFGIPKRRKVVDVKSVLFLECMGPPSGGFRHRSNAWAERLSHQGVQAEVWFAADYKKQLRLKRTRIGMLRLHLIYLSVRFVQCFRSARYDAVIVRREILLYNDYGNLFFEKWMRRIHGNLILDVDDDISAAKHEPRRLSLFGTLMSEHPQKFRASLAYYDKVFVASDYLQKRLTTWCNEKKPEMQVLPTCVNPHEMPRKRYDDKNEIVIGWIGSSNNFKDLYLAYPALEKLCNEQHARFTVVSDAKPREANFPIPFIPWSLENEYENFLQIDIGIMPVNDDAEGRGKGGLKLIQYMGCGLVSVASAVTINNEIVRDGVNGFLVQRESEWYNVLTHVISQRQRFSQIGEAAAQTIRNRFSYDAHEKNVTGFIGLNKQSETTNEQFSTTHQAVK